MIQKRFDKLISFILITALLFCALPATLFSDETKVPDPSQTGTNIAPEELKEPASAIMNETSGEPQDATVEGMAVAASAYSYENYALTRVPDGIYAFKNMGNNGLWMDIERNKTEPGYHVQQYAYSCSPAIEYSASALFKVTQIGTTGRYTIRLMLNTNLTFGFDGNEVITKEIPANDADVDINDTFRIDSSTGGYMIIPYGSSFCVGANNTTASGAAGKPLSYLIKTTFSNSETRCIWIMEGYRTYITDGVYSFKNMGNSGRWMDIERNMTVENYHVQQYGYSSSPAGSFMRPGLFKVSQIGDTGRYVIRLMLNNKLTFEVSGEKLLTKETNVVDSLVPTSQTFYILFNGGGFLIKPANSSGYVSTPNTTDSGTAGGEKSKLKIRTLEDAGNRARWKLERYTGPTQSGMTTDLGEGPYYIGEQVTFTAAYWTTAVNCNKPSVITDSTDGAAADVSWDSNGVMGILLEKKPGTLNLGLRICKGNTTSSYVTTNKVSCQLKLNFPEDIYLVKNVKSELYMESTGGDVEIHPLDGGYDQRWIFTHLEYGYYSIRSSDTGLALTVPSGKETSDNVELVLSPFSTTNNNQKWKITLTKNGSYKIKAKSSESYTAKDLVMDVNPSFL